MTALEAERIYDERYAAWSRAYEQRRADNRKTIADALRAGKQVVEGIGSVWPSPHYLERDPDKLARHIENRCHGFGWDFEIREAAQ